VPAETTAQLAPGLDTPEALDAFVSVLYRKVLGACAYIALPSPTNV
jgi:hypothetical protein